MPDVKLSLLEDGKPGLHLIINPQKPLALAIPKDPKDPRDYKDLRHLNPKISQVFRQHGIILSDKELRSLKAGRDRGIDSIKTLLSSLGPYLSLGPDEKEKLATKLADILMSKSLEAQLSRTVPTALQRNEQAEQKLQEIFRQTQPADGERGTLPNLLGKVPFGVSLKIHLPVNWL